MCTDQLLVSETQNVHVGFMAMFVGIVVVPKLPVTAFLLSCLFLVMLITLKKKAVVLKLFCRHDHYYYYDVRDVRRPSERNACQVPSDIMW